MIEGAAAEWLAAHRDELNLRMMETLERYPHLSVPNFFTELGAILPALSASASLLNAAYDLVLLHLARTAFARTPALRRLLSEWAPQRLALLSAQPQLLAQLSNATENSPRPDEFVTALIALPELDAATLLQTGAVTAWRLGDPRIRTAALALLPALPARALLVAMGHADWPDTSAPMLAAQLQVDQWRVYFSAPPVSVTVPRLDVKGSVHLASLGDFSGFGGVFDTPPRLLVGEDPHLFKVRCRSQGFSVVADGFGAQIKPLLGTLPADEVSPPSDALTALTARGVAGQAHGHVLVLARRDSHRLEVLG